MQYNRVVTSVDVI